MIHRTPARGQRYRKQGLSEGVRKGSFLMVGILCPKQQDAVQIPSGRKADAVNIFPTQVWIGSETRGDRVWEMEITDSI